MTWFDITKRGFGMSNRSKKLVDEVMLEVDEPLNARAIMNLIHVASKKMKTSLSKKCLKKRLMWVS